MAGATVNLQQIADRAGVSKATVSLALRDDRRVKEETRARVKQLAGELGYRRSPTLSRLASFRWRPGTRSAESVLAYVTAGGTRTTRRGDSLTGLTAEALQRGFHLSHFPMDDLGGPKRLAQVLMARGIETVLFDRIFDPAFASQFPWEEVIAVAMHRGAVAAPVERVATDVAAAARLCFAKCWERGYRRLALVTGGGDVDADSAFIARCVLARCAEEAEGATISLESAPAATEGWAAWLARVRPECIVGMSDRTYAGLAEGGLEAPRDVAFVSILATQGGEGGGSLAGASTMDTEVEARALDLIATKHQYNRYGCPTCPTEVHLTPSWVEGASLPSR